MPKNTRTPYDSPAVLAARNDLKRCAAEMCKIAVEIRGIIERLEVAESDEIFTLGDKEYTVEAWAAGWLGSMADEIEQQIKVMIDDAKTDFRGDLEESIKDHEKHQQRTACQ